MTASSPRDNRQRRQRRGASAIEFALTLPFLFGIFSGVFEYGMVFFNQVGVINAVRDGARIAVAADESDATMIAEARAYEVLDEFGLNCDEGCQVSATLGTAPGGYSTISVSAQVPYTPLFGLIPTPENLSGSIVMRYESLNFGD
jgi:Flp pilus assembly protein TadG